jgi:hypothetical protein
MDRVLEFGQLEQNRNLMEKTMKLDTASKNLNGRKTSMPPALPTAKTGTLAAAPEAGPAVAAGQKSKVTVTIEAKVDVGFGNNLYLRGEGHGLSWNQGIPLKCVDQSTWKWSGEASEQLKFKLLLNDAVWAKGDNLVASPGQRIQVSPAF